jgi:hypothetical protein
MESQFFFFCSLTTSWATCAGVCSRHGARNPPKKKKKKPQQNSAPINLGTAVLQKLGMYGGGLAICLGFRMTSVYCTVTAPGLVMSNTDSYKGSREQANTVTSCII